jgi:broad specificity phosphatase PhoE
MTHFILVRHGETDWNREGRYQGQSDPPLDEQGRLQAEALAASLAGRGIEAIYSSDLQRASETARVLSARLGLPLVLDPRLREIHQGEWEGRLVDDIRRAYPEAWALQWQQPLHARAPGGESIVEVGNRVSQAADEIASWHPDAMILIVSHALSIAILQSLAIHLPLEGVRQRLPENSAVEEIDWPPDPARTAQEGP